MNDPRQKDFDERHTKLPTVTALTKREYFAAMALQGLLSNPEYTQGLKDNYKAEIITDMNLMCVRESIDMADELIKQLEQK